MEITPSIGGGPIEINDIGLGEPQRMIGVKRLPGDLKRVYAVYDSGLYAIDVTPTGEVTNHSVINVADFSTQLARFYTYDDTGVEAIYTDAGQLIIKANDSAQWVLSSANLPFDTGVAVVTKVFIENGIIHVIYRMVSDNTLHHTMSWDNGDVWTTPSIALGTYKGRVDIISHHGMVFLVNVSDTDPNNAEYKVSVYGDTNWLDFTPPQEYSQNVGYGGMVVNSGKLYFLSENASVYLNHLGEGSSWSNFTWEKKFSMTYEELSSVVAFMTTGLNIGYTATYAFNIFGEGNTKYLMMKGYNGNFEHATYHFIEILVNESGVWAPKVEDTVLNIDPGFINPSFHTWDATGQFDGNRFYDTFNEREFARSINQMSLLEEIGAEEPQPDPEPEPEPDPEPELPGYKPNFSKTPIEILTALINHDNNKSFSPEDMLIGEIEVIDHTSHPTGKNTRVTIDLTNLPSEVDGDFVEFTYNRVPLWNLFSSIRDNQLDRVRELSIVVGNVFQSELFYDLLLAVYGVRASDEDFACQYDRPTNTVRLEAKVNNPAYTGMTIFNLDLSLASRVLVVDLDGFSDIE